MDEMQFTRKFGGYRGMLYSLAFRLTNGDHHWSEDLVQDTLATAYTDGHTIRQNEKVGQWLRTTLFRHYLRQKQECKKHHGSIPHDAVTESLFQWLNDAVQPDMIVDSTESTVVQNQKVEVLKNHLTEEQIEFLLCWMFWSGNTTQIAKEFTNPRSRMQSIQIKLASRLHVVVKEMINTLQLTLCLPVEPIQATLLYDFRCEDRYTLLFLPQMGDNAIQYSRNTPRIDVASAHFSEKPNDGLDEKGVWPFLQLCTEIKSGKNFNFNQLYAITSRIVWMFRDHKRRTEKTPSSQG